MTTNLLSASSMMGTNVINRAGENLGDIKDIMIDTASGNIAYVVVSFGGFLGIGDKYFAIPMEAFHIDRVDENFVLDVDREKLENAPGFDKDNWPSSADRQFLTDLHSYYGYRPYWEREHVYSGESIESSRGTAGTGASGMGGSSRMSTDPTRDPEFRSRGTSIRDDDRDLI